MAFTQGYKVNPNTQYEFTVSNETIQEVITDDGIIESDITDYCYTALHDSRINALHAESSSAWSYGPSEFDGWVEDDCAFRLFRGVPIPTLNKDLNEPVTDVYERNLLTWNGTIYPGTENEKTGTFLVMDMKDIKKWYAEYTSSMFSQTSVASTATKYGQTSAAPGYTGSCYTYVSNTVVNYSIDPAEEVEVEGTLRFLNVFVLNDELWVGLLNPSSHGEAQTMHSVNSWYNGGNNFVKGYLNVNDPSDKLYQRGTTGYYGVSLIPDLVYDSAVDTDLQTYPEGTNGIIMYGNCANSQINLYSGDYAKDLNTILTWQSWCGIKFKFDNTMYKPIIEGGIIVGYSDDMDAESEYDDMTNVTGNNIPSGPPKPPPEPDTDDPWHGVSYGSGGYGASPFCTSYAMTGAELTQLSAWGGKTEEQGGPKAGYDYMPSIISLVEMPMEVSGTVPSTVKFSRGTLGGYESNIVDTGVSGNPITAATQRYNLGSVTLPLRMSERGYPFLDWDTVVELYMPFVGMFSLDPFAVLGKTITAFMDLDVLNGTICGYAYVTNGGQNLPIAYGSAQVGVSLPVTSDGAATARLALTTANAQLGSSMASSILQSGALAAAGGTSAVKGSNAWSSMQSARGAGLAAQTGRNIFAGGASDAVGGYVPGMAQGSVVNSFANWGLSLKQLQSSNNTQVNGSLGGGSFSGWSTPNAAYVKIIRPHAAPGAKASEYGKTHAYPYEANATLASCKGLTFAVNPNVTGITKATDAERSQIADILMGGVIA